MVSLFFQLARFGIVGVTAASVHFAIVVFLVELHYLQPLIANIVAFCIAVQVSYWGHRIWTFRGTKKNHWVAFSRLLLVSIVAFTVNESMFYILMTEYQLPYPVALFLILTILPFIVFAVNKMWVFE